MRTTAKKKRKKTLITHSDFIIENIYLSFKTYTNICIFNLQMCKYEHASLLDNTQLHTTSENVTVFSSHFGKDVSL